MMEKNKFLTLIVMIGMFLFVGVAKAEEVNISTCSAADLNTLRQDASLIKATYIPNEIQVGEGNARGGEESDAAIMYVLDLKVYNVNSKFLLKYEYSGKKIQSGSFYRDFTNTGSDGAITVRQKSYNTVINYTITVISNFGSCRGQTIRTIRVTLPKYNYYSSLEACEGIQDYYLCQPYITFDVDENTFFNKVSAYSAKMAEAKEVDMEEDNNSVVSKTLTAVSKHKYLVVGIVVAVGVAATVLIIKRKKSEA